MEVSSRKGHGTVWRRREVGSNMAARRGSHESAEIVVMKAGNRK